MSWKDWFKTSRIEPEPVILCKDCAHFIPDFGGRATCGRPIEHYDRILGKHIEPLMRGCYEERYPGPLPYDFELRLEWNRKCNLEGQWFEPRKANHPIEEGE